MSVAEYALSIVVTKRPYFGKRQIRHLDQIHKGLLIRIRNEDTNTVFEVIRRYKDSGFWKLDLRFRKDSTLWKRTILLEDYSVIGNKNGNWSSNWLEKA
jgi:hypothetical protein